MGSDTDVTTEITNEVTNDMFNEASSVCGANCTNVLSGNIIACNGCSGIDINQTCTTSAQCVMNQQMDTQLENFMSAVAEQDVKQTLGMFSFDFTSTDVKVDIKNGFNNTLTQILNTTCATDSTNLVQNNVIYATNTDGGSIGITQDASANSNCVMTNMSKFVSKSSENAMSSQSLTQRNALVMIIVGIIAIFIIFIMVIVVGVLGLFGMGLIGGKSGGGTGEGTEKKKSGGGLDKYAKYAALL